MNFSAHSRRCRDVDAAGGAWSLGRGNRGNPRVQMLPCVDAFKQRSDPFAKRSKAAPSYQVLGLSGLMKPEDLPGDEVVDPVLERLVASLPADRRFAGDEAILARSVNAALARRAAALAREFCFGERRARGRRTRSWIALAAANAALIGLSTTAILTHRGDASEAVSVVSGAAESPPRRRA